MDTNEPWEMFRKLIALYDNDFFQSIKRIGFANTQTGPLLTVDGDSENIHWTRDIEYIQIIADSCNCQVDVNDNVKTAREIILC